MLFNILYFNYLVLDDPTFVLVKQRAQKDIWQNLYEFPLIESKDVYVNETLPFETEILKVSQPVKHVLSHQNIFTKFYLVKKIAKPDGYTQVNKDNLDKLTFPRLINRFLENSSWI